MLLTSNHLLFEFRINADIARKPAAIDIPVDLDAGMATHSVWRRFRDPNLCMAVCYHAACDDIPRDILVNMA